MSPAGLLPTALNRGAHRERRRKKLDRDVAIEVLPQSVAADPDTLARFERKATGRRMQAVFHQGLPGKLRALIASGRSRRSHNPLTRP